MKRIPSLAVCLLVATALFAVSPPTQPAVLPAPVPTIDIEAPAVLPAPVVTIFKKSTLETLALDWIVKRDLMQHIRFHDTDTPPPLEPGGDLMSSQWNGQVSTRLYGRPQTNTSITSTGQASNDAHQELEPAVITNRYSGVDRSTYVYMRYPNPNTLIPTLWWTTTTDWSTFTTPSQLPLPMGHSRAGDPILSENPYISLGQFPKRVYCSGISYGVDGSGNYTGGSVNYWYNDNPGTNAWTLTQVDTVGSTQFLDKPSNWTSWHSGTLGYVYMAAVLVPLSGGNNTLYVYRKTTTNAFTRVNTSITGASISSPIVTVDAATGDVYLLWVNWNNHTISVARSTDQASTFGTAVAFTAGPTNERLLSAGSSICDSGAGNCVRGASVIMARPNAADNSIGVVWHRRELNGNNTDVFFNRFDLSTQTWGTAVRVNTSTAGDQFNPALDPDVNGDYMVTFYNKSDDANDRLYRTYCRKITASGGAGDASNTLVLMSARGSDPGQLTVDASNGLRYMGEYQDIWEWLGTWYAVTLYVPDPNNGGSGQADIYAPRISP
ncbi:MAG TPA: hypothetical protein VFP80_14260 [Thermoanaerobaculia bacterium]|nr:hypothetical protein [Thermoanaerobaculia bacterium]